MLKRLILALCFALGVSSYTYAQFSGFSHEIGIITGPVAMQSDYGERNNLSTNAGNTGFGIGIVHYMNFSYAADCNCYTEGNYFNDHFKIRTELSYSKTDLQHFGRWVDKESNSLGVTQLQGMRGSTELINAGVQLEFFPFSIRDFMVTTGSFAPFLSLGCQYSFYNPEAYSTLGPLGLAHTTFPKYLDPSDGRPHGYSSQSGNVWSVVSSVGTRYKLDTASDLMVDLRMQYYFSNWVDGLNPDPVKYPENKANDWLVWFNVGYVYYLN